MLTIEIDSSGLDAIYAAGQVVTLTRRVECLIGGASRTGEVVAWQTFAPFETNKVAIDDELYCFATTTPVRRDAVLVMNSRHRAPMRAGAICILENGRFSTRSLEAGADAFAASNAMRSRAIGLGVAQAATINDEAQLRPACVCPVLRNETVEFRSSPTIGIFLSSCATSGTIIAPVAGRLEVDGHTDAIVHFDPGTNRFFENG